MSSSAPLSTYLGPRGYTIPKENLDEEERKAWENETKEMRDPPEAAVSVAEPKAKAEAKAKARAEAEKAAKKGAKDAAAVVKALAKAAPKQKGRVKARLDRHRQVGRATQERSATI